MDTTLAWSTVRAVIFVSVFMQHALRSDYPYAMESVCCMNGVGLTNYTPILNLPEERRPATSDGRYVLEHPNTGQSEPTVIESRSTAGPAYKTMWHLAVRLEDLSQRDTTDVVTMGAAKETKQSALAYWIPFRPALWSSVPSYVEDTSQEAEPDFALCEGSKRNSIRPSLSITPKAVVSPSDPSILLLQSLPVTFHLLFLPNSLKAM